MLWRKRSLPGKFELHVWLEPRCGQVLDARRQDRLPQRPGRVRGTQHDGNFSSLTSGVRAPSPALDVSLAQREALENLSRSATAEHREVIRAKALLLAGEGLANTAISKRLGVSPASVSAWREARARGVSGSP